ncbi:hypothetical protein SAMN05428959_101680 [Duganella sp. CF517]|uniref:hypothetical protein n=1 Tax=Duganella sp. CF517 TaxID=1881038 RepID=UPI0008B91909|nr:hypothetical protein [Duganella sp. CF517]SEN21090.1 hypothetical protein SAMN05428959_101680 [Duganella sp. CF517]
MTTLTISNSGTAWIRDMQAQGKSAGGGWASSPNAAYYASLDTEHPLPKPVSGLPTTFAELLKARGAQEEQRPPVVGQQAASPHPTTGQRINVTA